MSVLSGSTGTAKFGWLNRLKISARNCTLKVSEIRLTELFLNNEKSNTDVPGPVKILRPELPRRVTGEGNVKQLELMYTRFCSLKFRFIGLHPGTRLG